jgi:hypothetical protein
MTKAKAENLFGLNTPRDERTRRSDAVLAEEDRRRAADAAKTARLRKLRLAKEAEERAAKASAPQSGGARLAKGKG